MADAVLQNVYILLSGRRQGGNEGLEVEYAVRLGSNEKQLLFEIKKVCIFKKKCYQRT